MQPAGTSAAPQRPPVPCSSRPPAPAASPQCAFFACHHSDSGMLDASSAVIALNLPWLQPILAAFVSGRLISYVMEQIKPSKRPPTPAPSFPHHKNASFPDDPSRASRKAWCKLGPCLAARPASICPALRSLLPARVFPASCHSCALKSPLRILGACTLSIQPTAIASFLLTTTQKGSKSSSRHHKLSKEAL